MEGALFKSGEARDGTSGGATAFDQFGRDQGLECSAHPAVTNVTTIAINLFEEQFRYATRY